MVAFGEAYFALQDAFVQHPFDPFSALVSPTVKHLRHIREHNVVTRRVQNLFLFVQDLIAVFSVLVLKMASVRVRFPERLFRLALSCGSRFTSWTLFHSKKTAKASARLYKGKESALHCMHKSSRHFVCLSLTRLRGVHLTAAGFDGQAPEKRKKGRASEPKTPDVSTATGMMW